MPDLGPYALEVGLAYGASAVLLAGLVGLSVWRAARIKRQLRRLETRHG